MAQQRKPALFGSSYIERLADFCNDDMLLDSKLLFVYTGGMVLFPDKIQKQRNKVYRDGIKDMEEFCPNSLFIHLGGNDISASSRPNTIVHELMKIFEEFRERGTRVYVGEILYRIPNEDKSPGLTLSSFLKQRAAINARLKSQLGGDFTEGSDIKFPVYFKNTKYDKVHLSDIPDDKEQSGLQRYFLRVRRTLMRQ